MNCLNPKNAVLIFVSLCCIFSCKKNTTPHYSSFITEHLPGRRTYSHYYHQHLYFAPIDTIIYYNDTSINISAIDTNTIYFDTAKMHYSYTTDTTLNFVDNLTYSNIYTGMGATLTYNLTTGKIIYVSSFHAGGGYGDDHYVSH